MLGGVLITTVVVGAPIIVLGAVRGLRLRHPGSSSVANIDHNSLLLPLTRFETKFMKNLLFFFRVVGVVSRLLAGRFAVRIPTGTGDFFSSPYLSDQLCGPYSSLLNGDWGSFLGVKQPERDVEHSFLSSSDVKSDWGYPSSSPVWRHGVDRNYFACKILKFSL